MTQRHRDFSPPDKPHQVPVSFGMHGELFTCVQVAPAGVLNDMIAGIRTDDTGSRVYSAPNLIAFVIGVLREDKAVEAEEAEALGFAGEGYEPLTADEALAGGHEPPEGAEKVVVVPADDVPRFYELMHDKRRAVPIEELGEVVLWLADVLMGRPMRPPGPSRRGRR